MKNISTTFLKMKKLFLLLTVILFSIPFASYATHIVGGELNYKCLGGNQYQIKLRVYRDCYTGVPPFDNPAAVGIFDNNNVLVTTIFLNFPGSTVLPPTVAQANVCVKTPTNICVEVAEYVGTVTLPPRAGGYQLAYQRCCRNPTVDNIVTPGDQGATYYARIPDQAFACNSNPVFDNWPPIFVCANNQILFDHSATDADGDVIVYSLCSPFTGGSQTNTQPSPPTAPPYSPITWKAPYSATNPLGGNTLTINSTTGMMSGTPTTLGQFVVGVCADEYRNGVLISTTKRDFQFNVINCQPDIVATSVYAYTNCATRLVTFTNNSTGTNSFFWNFGVTGITTDTSRLKNPTFNYPAVGTYTVTLIAFSGISSKCNDTLKNFVVNVTECPPCTMTLGITKVDAKCGAAVSGCTQVTWNHPCAGAYTIGAWGGMGGAAGANGCSLTKTYTNGGAAPLSTIPSIVINGVTLPQSGVTTGDTIAIASPCTQSFSYSSSGGIATTVFNLTIPSGAAPGSATVTPSSGVGPYTYSWSPSGGNAATANGLTAGSYTVTVVDNAGCTKTGSVVINATTAMVVTPSKTSPTTCGGTNGTASVTASGGSGPYTYLWSTGQTTQGINGLSAGVYTVRVSDAGCPLTTTITVTEPIILNVATSKTDALCNGNNGTITANPSLGTGPYTYSWGTSPVQTGKTATGLSAGTYTVTATDIGGCKGTASASIISNSLASTSTHTNPTCGGTTGGTATIIATGGTTAYNYSWNSSPVQTTSTATGLSGGDYIGTVIDAAGCTDTVMVSINEPSQVLPEPKNTSTTTCLGVSTGSAHVDVSGGVAGFTYLWNNGATTQDITGLSAGTYTITVTDSKGCTGTNSIAVIYPAVLTLSSITSSVSTCSYGDNGAATVSPAGGAPGFTYSWATSPVQTGQTATNLSVGTYTVTVTDSKGCTARTTVAIAGPAPIAMATASVPMGCVSSNGTASVTASGGTGSHTYVWAPGGQTNSTATGLSTGTYTVTATDANGCTGKTTVTVSNAGLPTAGMSSQTDVDCSGNATGSATITASGGTPGYTYSWSPGGQTTSTGTGLSARTYTVTVTDTNGCTTKPTVTINQPTILGSGIGSQISANCSGSATGSATVTATGGNPNYTYSWNPGGQTTAGVSGLTAGTYNVIITDTKGCSKSQAVTINQPTAVIANATSTTATCGQSNGSATVTASGGTGGHTYVWTPSGQTTLTATGLSAGGYVVLVTDANGCTTNASVSVNNANGPTAGISTQTNVLCNGAGTGSATVTATGGSGTLTYTWNNGVTSTTGNATGLSAGTYIVTITDGSGCAQGQTVIITQPANPVTAGISIKNDVDCRGNATGGATITAAGGTPGYTYNWSPGTQTTATVSGLTEGTYTVIIADVNSCSVTQAVVITQPASVLNTNISSMPATCGNSNGTVSVTATGGTSTYTYIWSPAGGTNSTASGLSPGPYNVTVTDFNGCTKTAGVTVINSGGPAASILSQADVKCKGDATGSATVTATGGTGTLTYAWTPNSDTTPSVSGLTAGTYTVIVSDSNNCSQQQLVTISEPSTNVGSTISSQVNVGCTGSATGSATVTGTGGTPGYTYIWSGSGTTTASMSGLSAGSYSVTVTDNNGCSTIQTVTITEPLNSIGSTISSQVNVGCTGGSTGSATVTGTGGTPGYTYLWSSSGTTTASMSGLSAGSYSVTVTDINGCSTIQIVTITQPLSAIITTTVSTNAACGSSNGTVTVNASGGTGTLTYLWSPGAQTTASVSGLTAGTYSVIVTDNNGCSQAATVTVAGSPGPSLVLSTKQNVSCNGLTNGSATVTVSSGTAPYTYTWTPNVSTSNTINNISAKTYTVVVTDLAGCKDTVLIDITQPQPVVFTFTNAGATVCAGRPLTLLTSTPTGGTPPYTYNWQPNGPVVSPLVPTTYSVTVTDGNGCMSLMDTIRVTPMPSPIAGFDTLSTGTSKQKYIFTDKSTGAITTWYWIFGDGTTSGQPSPTHIFPGAGTYTVTQIVTGPSGCSDTISKVIIVLEHILIPNVFTPNGDGINDEFFIPSSGFESFEIAIYNRWGTMLWRADSGEIRWDGRTTAGQPVSDGTYFYILKAQLKSDWHAGGTTYDKHGFINLVRGGGK